MNFKGKTFWEMEKESISYAHRYENLWINYAVIAAALAALERNELELDHAFKDYGVTAEELTALKSLTVVF